MLCIGIVFRMGLISISILRTREEKQKRNVNVRFYSLYKQSIEAIYVFVLFIFIDYSNPIEEFNSIQLSSFTIDLEIA